MDLRQRKRPPPARLIPSQIFPLPSATITNIFPANLDPEAVTDSGAERRLARTLWKYGRAVDAIFYLVGRVSWLPCSKGDVRLCLLEAINLTCDAEMSARLREGYIRLEAFVSDAEFDMIQESQTGLPGTDRTARAILTRVAAQMAARRREIWRSS